MVSYAAVMVALQQLSQYSPCIQLDKVGSVLQVYANVCAW